MLFSELSRDTISPTTNGIQNVVSHGFVVGLLLFWMKRREQHYNKFDCFVFSFGALLACRMLHTRSHKSRTFQLEQWEIKANKNDENKNDEDDNDEWNRNRRTKKTASKNEHVPKSSVKRLTRRNLICVWFVIYFCDIVTIQRFGLAQCKSAVKGEPAFAHTVISI